MDTTVTVNQPRITSIETLFVRDTNQPNYTTVTESDGGSGNPADNYCGPAEQWTMDDSTVYYGRQTCYQFDTYQKTVTTPGSRGDDSTAFGFNFPGGPANGAATTTEYDNVAVTPGATNVFSISPNGLITVTYWAYV
jgi:hypothetical protein